jgi:hypothetical protein
MKAGDQVIISGPPGVVTATIIDVRPPAALPDVPILPSAECRAILVAECSRVALFQYSFAVTQHSTTDVMFIALEDFHGIWHDLQGQVLDIQPAPAPQKKEWLT